MNRLVLLAPNWLGDAVMALPAIADVCRALPGTTIAVAARRSVAPLFLLVSGIDRVIILDGPADLKDERFDAALLLPNSFQAAYLASRASIPERWGYRTDWRGRLLTRAIARPTHVHQVEYYQRLVAGLGFVNGSALPRITAGDSFRVSAAELLRASGWDGRAPLVALAPGAAYGGAKRWPPAYFADLAAGFADGGMRTVMVGSAADAETGRAIEAATGAAPPLNLIGATDIPRLAGVLAQCRALVSNDSGAMHVGAALGIPVIAVFGPTNERETGPGRFLPSGPEKSDVVVLTHAVWCRPCMLRECPLDHRCMRGVGVAAVAQAARRLVNEGRGSERAGRS